MAHFPLAKRRAFLYKVFRRAEVAQLVEQGTENPRVGSSILSLGTIFRARNVVPGFFFFRRERTGTHFRSAPPGGTAGTTLPPQKVEFSPERLCPPCARAQELSGDAHTSASSSGSAQKSGVAARPNLPSERLSAPDCPPRELWRHGCAALPCAASRAPSHAAPELRGQPLPPPPSLSSPLRSGRACPPCGSRRLPAALSPAPCPSALLPHACCPRFPSHSFPRFFPFARFPPPSSRPSLFAARLHHAPRPASGALRRPDAERLRRPKPPQPLSGKKEERNDAGSAQKRVSGQVLRTRSETEK